LTDGNTVTTTTTPTPDTTVTTNPAVTYTDAQIQNAIDASRAQGFTDDQIRQGAARYGVNDLTKYLTEVPVTPVSPTPVSPTPVSPTPVSPTPVTPVSSADSSNVLSQSDLDAIIAHDRVMSGTGGITNIITRGNPVPGGDSNNPAVPVGTPYGFSSGVFDANGNPVLNTESGLQEGAFPPTVLNVSDQPVSAHDAAIIAMENAAAAQRTKEQNAANTEVQSLTTDAINRTENDNTLFNTNTATPVPSGIESLVPSGGDQTQTQIQTQPADTNPVDAGQTSGWDSGNQTLQYAGNDFGGGWGQESSYDSNYRGKGGGYVSNFKNANNLSFYNSGLTHHATGGLAALAMGGMAQGGMYNLGSYSDGGRLLRGPGDGVSDSIPATIGQHQPARLADGEFVIPARIVSELGNGSTEAGARKLYAMMDRVQQARGKTTGKNSVAVNSRADKHLPI
jgi:hypothetical protein